ncbi:MAG: hypothetical protein OEZ36_14395 [Spirochaetota bacterium]|nr:hypothetical protein [Spirochaetota bacterium]
MGGIGFELPVSPLPEEELSPGRSVSPPHRLLERVRDFIYMELRVATNTNKIFKKFYNKHIRDFMEDADAEGQWEATEKELSFYFMDCAGLCVFEMEIATHWLSQVIWYCDDNIRNAFGVRGYKVDFSGLESMVKNPDMLFFVYQDKPCGIYLIRNDEDDKDIYTAGEERFHYYEMSDEDKAFIDNILKEKLCLCPLCVRIRKYKDKNDQQKNKIKTKKKK